MAGQLIDPIGNVAEMNGAGAGIRAYLMLCLGLEHWGALDQVMV